MKDRICNYQVWLDMLSTTMSKGEVLSPRGHEIREIRDLQITVDPMYPFMSFIDRNYKLDYFKHEMRWKLGASKFDDSIEEHASMWKTVKNPDGTFNSNYGQYWFGEQMGLWHVACELIRDHDSRRAVIPMLNKDHMTAQTVDTVCTESVGFHVRDSCLHMSIHMRSSDQIFGLGTDIPTFAFLYRLVYALIEGNVEGLRTGDMTITAMSSHIYSRHYDMVDKIIQGGTGMVEFMEMPRCESVEEAMYIVAKRGRNDVVWNMPLASWIA